MAPSKQQQQQCAKYQYVVTSTGPKIVPVPDVESKDEESAADYNTGGYLCVKLQDTFKDGRYVVIRKLGYVASIALELFFLNRCHGRVLTSHICSFRWGHFSTVWLIKDKEYAYYYVLHGL